jgi:hypothetical protein
VCCCAVPMSTTDAARRASDGITRLEQLGVPEDTGPAKFCVACVGTGICNPAADGVNKLKIYAGTKVDNSAPVIETFVSKAHAAVLAAEAPGAEREAEPVPQGGCGAERNYNAANASGYKVPKLLSRVLIGAFCSHFFPLLSTFVLSSMGGALLEPHCSAPLVLTACDRDVPVRPRGLQTRDVPLHRAQLYL